MSKRKIEKWFKVGKGLYVAIVGKGTNREIVLRAGARYLDQYEPPPRNGHNVKVGTPARLLDCMPVWDRMTLKVFKKIVRELKR
jgi:hypothetical protein